MDVTLALKRRRQNPFCFRVRSRIPFLLPCAVSNRLKSHGANFNGPELLSSCLSCKFWEHVMTNVELLS